MLLNFGVRVKKKNLYVILINAVFESSPVLIVFLFFYCRLYFFYTGIGASKINGKQGMFRNIINAIIVITTERASTIFSPTCGFIRISVAIPTIGISSKLLRIASKTFP
jgi:hypothetical protein